MTQMTWRMIFHVIVIEVMLPIMFLAINVPILRVLGVLQPLAFLRGHAAIALGFVFHALNAFLLLA